MNHWDQRNPTHVTIIWWPHRSCSVLTEWKMACFSFSLHYQDILAILFSKSYLVSSVHVTGWISPRVEIALYSAFFRMLNTIFFEKNILSQFTKYHASIMWKWASNLLYSSSPEKQLLLRNNQRHVGYPIGIKMNWNQC